MADTSRDEKTEEATPRRREELRKQGQVARSSELNSALILFMGAIVLYFTGPAASAGLRRLFTDCLGHWIAQPMSAQACTSVIVQVSATTLAAFGPMMGGLFVVAALASYCQVGFMVTGEAISPKVERLDPFKGFARLLSMKSLAKLAVTLLKVAVVGAVAYLYIQHRMSDFPPLLDAPIPAIYELFCRWTFELVFIIALAFLVIAVADYAFQRWDFERDIRMSKQELREELKSTEGDPLVKGRVRQIQREVANRRMMHEVPKADVVIKNPTRYAVALRYQAGRNRAPVVVAKGMNLIALKILEIARQHNVPEVENRPLAQTLYKTAEIGSEIPPALYRAVAEVLAYVYRLRAQKRR